MHTMYTMYPAWTIHSKDCTLACFSHKGLITKSFITLYLNITKSALQKEFYNKASSTRDRILP